MLNKSLVRRLTIVAFFILTFTAGVRAIHISGGGYQNYPERVISSDEATVIISIPTGASGAEIGSLLASAGVVASSESFFRAAVADPKGNSIAPGTHKVCLRISGREALRQLLDPSRITNLIKISEGAWNSEIFTEIAKTHKLSGDLSVASKSVKLPIGISNLEGVLFPAQYSFADGTSAVRILQSMVDKFNQEIAKIDFTDPNGKLKKADLLTLASLIQAEGDVKDFSKISRVIRNRLDLGMPLQLDSTIHYLKSTRGEIFLSNKSTKLKSPYNTYQNYGLPPAPIGNPGLAALTAAVKPESGDWLFFITVSPGDTRFTKSIAEFNNWKSLYQKNRRAGAFN